MRQLPSSRGPVWLKGTIEPYEVEENEVEEIVPASPKLDNLSV